MTEPLQTEEQRRQQQFLISERKADVVIKRMRKELEPYTKTGTNLVEARRSMEAIWQLMARRSGFELRQTWLIKAGWDPGGWVFMNWKQLPESLQYDLGKLGMRVMHELLQDAIKRHKGELERLKQSLE